MLTVTSDFVTIVGFLVSSLSLLLLILLKMIPRFLPRLLGVFFFNLIKNFVKTVDFDRFFRAWLCNTHIVARNCHFTQR